MNKTEIEEIKNIFNSIICLAVEGPDATSVRAVINSIIKEAGRGYNLADSHLTQQSSGRETPCDYCSIEDLCVQNFCPRCGRKLRR